MKDYGFDVYWSDEDKGYIATCPDFPGLSAFGKSREEALKEGHVALELFVNDYKQRGEQLPKPTKVMSYSGQIRLRMSKELHSRLAKAAAKSGMSLNTYIFGLLSERNAAKETLSALKDEICKMLDYTSPKKVAALRFPQYDALVESKGIFTRYDLEEGADYEKVTYYH